MKPTIKGGLIGFIILFIGLWIFLLVTGHDQNGWKCVSVERPYYCEFLEFASSPVHWAFVLFFSWVGFAGGLIDVIMIKKTIEKSRGKERRLPLKITSIVVLTLVIVIGIIGILAFENWVETMIYVIVFAVFTMFVSWFIGRKKKYGK
jgi:hypothetical protein